MSQYLIELLKRKDLLMYLVQSGLKAEHRNSYLGYFWWLLDPLLNAAVYYFLIKIVLGYGGELYGLYLIIGLIAWRWTSTVAHTSARSIYSNKLIINQVYLPKVIFPMSRTIAQFVHFIFGFSAIVVFLAYYQVMPGWQVIYLPLIVLIQLFLMLAISMIVAYACVFVRDIDNIISHVVRIWFYVTPVIWEEHRITEGYRWIVDINPMATILQAYRDVIMYHKQPDDLNGLIIVGLASLVMCFILMFFYSRNEHKIIKVL